MAHRSTWLFVGVLIATLGVQPTVAVASELSICPELKAALAEVPRGFAAHKGALLPPGSDAKSQGKTSTYQAKKTMAGAKDCRVVDVSMDEPKMLIRQTGYSCQFPATLKIDKALRSQLARCVAGEADDDSDPDEFTIWVDRVSSGEGYRGTEVSAHANAVDGLTLWVRQTVCTNKGKGLACEE